MFRRPTLAKGCLGTAAGGCGLRKKAHGWDGPSACPPRRSSFAAPGPTATTAPPRCTAGGGSAPAVEEQQPSRAAAERRIPPAPGGGDRADAAHVRGAGGLGCPRGGAGRWSRMRCARHSANCVGWFGRGFRQPELLLRVSDVLGPWVGAWPWVAGQDWDPPTASTRPRPVSMPLCHASLQPTRRRTQAHRLSHTPCDCRRAIQHLLDTFPLQKLDLELGHGIGAVPGSLPGGTDHHSTAIFVCTLPLPDVHDDLGALIPSSPVRRLGCRGVSLVSSVATRKRGTWNFWNNYYLPRKALVAGACPGSLLFSGDLGLVTRAHASLFRVGRLASHIPTPPSNPPR